MIVAALILFRRNSLGRLAAPFCAVIIHEAGHLLMASVLKLPINCIKLDIFGAYIETSSLACSYKKEAALCLAGPLANLVSILPALLMSKSLDTGYFIVLSVAFALINLLPAEDFDGGRILFSILVSFCSFKTSHSIITLLSFVCIFALWSISVYFLMRTGAYLSLFIFSGALFAKLFVLDEEPQSNFKE